MTLCRTGYADSSGVPREPLPPKLFFIIRLQRWGHSSVIHQMCPARISGTCVFFFLLKHVFFTHNRVLAMSVFPLRGPPPHLHVAFQTTDYSGTPHPFPCIDFFPLHFPPANKNTSHFPPALGAGYLPRLSKIRLWHPSFPPLPSPCCLLPGSLLWSYSASF